MPVHSPIVGVAVLGAHTYGRVRACVRLCMRESEHTAYTAPAPFFGPGAAVRGALDRGVQLLHRPRFSAAVCEAHIGCARGRRRFRISQLDQDSRPFGKDALPRLAAARAVYSLLLPHSAEVSCPWLCAPMPKQTDLVKRKRDYFGTRFRRLVMIIPG